MKTLAFINPKAGELNGFTSPAEIENRFAGYGIRASITIGRNTADMKRFIAKVRRQKPQVVIIAGGDGTISTIAKGLIGRKVKLGLIPTGSLNNLGSTIGLSGDIDEALETINRGHVTNFDAARVGRKYILEGLGIGLIARIFDQSDWDKDKDVIALAKTTVTKLMTANPIKVRARIEEQSFKFETTWLTVTNLGRIGSLTIDPHSKPYDGVMELVYCKPLTALELPVYAASFLRSNHLEKDKFETRRIKKLILTLPKGTIVHLDDETHRLQRLTVTVLPGALQIFAPPQ